MTDVTNGAVAAPIAAPAADSSIAPTMPAATFEADQLSEFDQNLNEFLGHSFDDDFAAGEPGQGQAQTSEAPQAGTQPAPQQNAPAGQSATPAPAGATNQPAPQAWPTQVQPAGQPASPLTGQANTPTGVAPVAGGGQQPEVDPNLLAAMMLGGQAAPAAPQAQPPVQTQPAPVQQTQPQPQGQPQGQPEGQQPASWTPFNAGFQLPPEFQEALFNGEPQQQAQALTALMTSLGNTITSMVEQRFTSHYAPQMQQQIVERQSYEQQARSVAADFYGANADLAPYKQVVLRAGEVYAQANPGMQYDEKARNAIAALARRSLQQMGVALAAPQAQPLTMAAPQAQAPQPFIADGARPEVYGGAEDPNSPAGLLDAMTQF